MHGYMSVSIWGKKEYQFILVLNMKWSPARGEPSEMPLLVHSKASEGFQLKSNKNGPGSNQRARGIKSWGCFCHLCDVWTLGLTFMWCPSKPPVVLYAVSQMSINLHRAICPGVKTSNISTTDSAFILFLFCKTHLFKAFSPLEHLFVSLFSISCLSLGRQSPWATVAALISNLKALGMMCHIRCVSMPVTFIALIIYMIYLTAPAKGH